MLLRGAGDNTSYLMPDHALPSDIRYVLTLDADTRLARDAVPDLVGRITHPVNRAVIDPKTGTVVRGYGILQPRVTPSLTSGADSSHYQRIFSVDRGLDPYVFTASDIYQDLLGEGSFTGKGLYDVDAVETSLAHRVPDNAVLSHDLLEGSWARAALVSDVQLVEDFPTRYEVELSRQHRWARGDWQLLPFIVNMSNGLTATARLKMVDNLRRSLVPVTWVLASCVGWLMLGSRAAIWWQFALMTTLFINPLLRFGFALIPTKPGVALARYLKTVVQDLGSDLLETFLKLTFIADQATAMADAIVRTFYRLAISRKHLLEWRTAHQVHQEAKSGILYYYRLMGYSTLGSTLMFLVIYHLRPVNLPVAAPFCILWLLAPFVAQFISRPLQTEDRLDIRGDDAEALRRIARETWRYFETFANAENNDLPPDNFQETPEPRLAARTSPTNIGLYLLSAISAHDFGWAPIEETVGRIERTLATLQRMEKFRGHIFNWYKTKTLEPMDPRYISAVDSGNLAGYLITVSSALRRWSAEPAKAVQQNITGIGDTFEILCRHLKHSPEEASSPLTSAMMLDQVLGDFRNRYHHILSDNTLPSAVLVESAEKIIQQMLEGDGQLPSEYDPDAFWWAEALAENCRSLVFDSHLSHAALEALSSRLEILSEKARSLAFEMDFGFLLNRERGLLSIGYRMADGELDAACYDLLASEARLASFFAIAKGDLPSEHWSRLGRPVTMVGSTAALVSWSGSMFEYLMPSLVLQEPLGGTLSQSNNAAIEKQIRYARTKGIPWGISESAFHARDRDMNYQYHAFGVPSLGLKRDLSEDTVIAPYASVLAAQYRPADAVLNLARLEKEGARGRFGFYDAVDYTPARIPNGRTSGIVQNYMAHHQGMSIVAIANATLEGIHRSRFHDDPVVEAAELLLQEKAPREIVPITPVPEKADRSNGSAEITNLGVSLIENPQSAMLQVAMLSNGRYAVTLTSNGAGSARIDGLDITRWRADPLCDHNGTKVFLRDLADNTWWQALPGRKLLPGEQSSAQFSDHKAEFMKTAHGIETQLECIAAHDANGEGRRLTIRNRSSHARTIEVTTYGEIVLDHSDADIAHRAFSNMFVKTLSRPEEGAILATRNQRAPHDRQLYFAHIMSDLAEAGPTTAETDRRAFIGRGRNLDNPAAFDSSARFEGGDDFSMDPIFALRRSVTILPGKQAQLVIWNIVTDSQDACDNAIAHYKRPETFEHESRLIWTHSQIRLRHMGVSVADASLFRRFAALLVYPDDSLSAEKKGGNSGAQPQSALWQHGISGDDPIMVLQIDNESDLPHVRKAVAMQEYLQAQGLLFDLVILNERAASYAQDLQNQIAAIVDHSFNAAIAAVGKHHVFGLRKDLIGDEAWQNLLASARITLHAGNGRLAEQFLRLEREKSKILAQDLRSRHDHENQSILKEETALASHKVDFPHEHLSFDNGMGGFSSDGREYVVRLRHGEFTPHPWINVISGKSFGFHVSAEGAGYTWAINSRDYQISPWSNDAVINAPGEGFYIRDNETGLIATPFAALSSDRDALYEARHGMGYSNFRVWTRWIDIKAEQTLDHDAAAKLTRLTLYNKTSRHLSLSVASYVDLVLGNNRERSAPHIQAGFSPNENAVIARNPYSLDYSGDELVCTIDRPVTWWCVNRREFIGPNGSVAMPLALQGKNHSPGKTDNTGGDPCVALATDVILEPGAELSLCFRMESRSHEDQPQPANRLNVQEFGTARARTDGEWKHFLSALQVHTPDPKLDLMVNTWLPYQTLACRIRARAAFYQASGAYGFRDQLQDATALLLYDPSLARSQILNAASRQFVEGDVQHWWLPSTGAGVRSSISDDIVWLSHALVRYITVTGDRSILHEDVPFIQGDPLKPGQHDSFFKPDAAPISASLYEHCARGLDLAVMRTGPNGLPQILGGDWNDGFNRVGQLGQGESIWLGWFLARTLSDFAPIAHERADQERAERWSGHVDRLRISLETAGWDGAWYRRAYYDDGVPLGSKDSPECRIDSIAQSWAAISGLAPRDRMDQAMDAVLERLVDDKNGIIRLFDPPFTNSQKDPGYIKAYPPGVRENGGQYTHAAAWVVQALALLGRGNDAHRCFDMINPISHTLTRDALNHYRTEPYAVAADIYGDGEKTGRGGWTWYTGSAGWLLRAAVEGILGITVTDKGKLHVKQAIPDQWPGFTADIRLNGKVRHLEVTRVAAGFEVLLDGVRFENEPVS
jgi:cyclic beta-1,2-glucan synthetase